MNQFQSARIKLTLWYVLICFLLNVFFSIGIYWGLTRAYNHQWTKQHQITTSTQQFKSRLIIIIAISHSIILLVSVGTGYFLAGRTLRPIKEAMDEQNRFITDASHELKTPITALRTEFEATLLEKKHLTVNLAKKVIQSGYEETISLQQLTENLMELTQQKQHKKLRKESISLLEIIEDSLKKVIPLARKKHITINVEQLTDALFWGERQSLIRLFIILLDNAIKYSAPKSKITITSQLLNQQIVIQVRDQGIGISQKDIPYIFERFYRVDKSRSQTNGYGLGLSIAKEIIHTHKGSIFLKSKLGAGTTFTLNLPLKQAK